jgi:hypothetical protein
MRRAGVLREEYDLPPAIGKPLAEGAELGWEVSVREDYSPKRRFRKRASSGAGHVRIKCGFPISVKSQLFNDARPPDPQAPIIPPRSVHQDLQILAHARSTVGPSVKCNTISRELRRNALDSGAYRPHVAYMLRRQRATVIERDAKLAAYGHGSPG